MSLLIATGDEEREALLAQNLANCAGSGAAGRLQLGFGDAVEGRIAVTREDFVCKLRALTESLLILYCTVRLLSIVWDIQAHADLSSELLTVENDWSVERITEAFLL